MVDTDPPESHTLESFFELRIDADPLSVTKMNKGYSKLRAIVMFPKVLTKTF